MATKKTTKKAAVTKTPTEARVEVSPTVIPKITLDMPLDEKRIKAIQKCLEKGRLRVVVNKVDLATGRLGDGWLYD